MLIMDFPTLNPKESVNYAKLAELANSMRGVRIAELFEQDQERATKMSVTTESLFLDYSKNLAPISLAMEFIPLAQELGLESFMEACLRGEKCNIFEQRAVLHLALRDSREIFIRPQTQEIYQDIQANLAKMQSLVEAVRSGEYRGFSGKKIARIVNVGIGGSDLGPRLVHAALRLPTSLPVDFISNIDISNLNEVWENIDPETTLFLIASKTFTTEESLTNASTLCQRFQAKIGDNTLWQKHFFALTANAKQAESWGILPENIFLFGEYIGGRFSLSGPIGLSVALSLGWQEFTDLLAGMHAADLHFFRSPWEQNIPFILAILGYWYSEFFLHQARGVFVYSHRLRYLVSYLQQLEMESNGKSVDRNGELINYLTNPLIIGGIGTDVQHSFFQQIHQGSQKLCADFIAVASQIDEDLLHQERLHANFLAQSRALMLGQKPPEPYRYFAGNIPSNTLIISRLNAYNLGYLLAVFEHKVMVQGVLWNICSYDQFGVELGKTMSREILNSQSELDASTLACLDFLRRAQE